MDKNSWRAAIIDSCRQVGTYMDEFLPVIDTLAGILEKRDKTEEQYIATGANAVITHTNRAKEKNYCKNPLLVVIGELNTQALSYWRDLGLTPSGLRKLKEHALENRRSALEEALNEILSGDSE